MPDTLPSDPSASPPSSPCGHVQSFWLCWSSYVLPCLGLYILLFLEAQFFIIQAPIFLPFLSSSVSVAPLAYICVGCGALLSALWLSARQPKGAALQSSALFWTACGAAGAVCQIWGAIWPSQQAIGILVSGLFLGWCLPPLVHGVFSRTSFAAQALIYTCATTLGQMTSIIIYTTELRAAQIYILSFALAAVGAIAGWSSRKGFVLPAADVNAPAPASTPPLPLSPLGTHSTHEPTQALILLTIIAVLFFGVHSMHNGDFHQYSTLRSQVPLWVYYVLMLTYPLLALIAIRFGLIVVAFMAVGLSAFDPVLASLQGSLFSYSIVYGLDAIATYGGTFFITLACLQLAQQLSRPLLCRALPFILLNAFYGGYWLVHSIVHWERTTIYIFSGAFVAVLTPVLALLHRVMFMPQGQHSGSAASIAPAATDVRGAGGEAALNAQEIRPMVGVNSLSGSDFSTNWGLSPREADVFALMLQGLNYADIGARLFISEATVKVHASRIFKKSGAKSRAQLMSLLLYAP